MIQIIVETHKNCNIKLSQLVFFVRKNNQIAKDISIKLDKMLLYKNIATNIIRDAKKYIIF